MMEPAQSLLFPPFRLDPLSGQLWRGTQLVPLRPKTFAVLRYLVEQAGRVVHRAELLQAVWPNTYGAEGLPKECIHELRQMLGDSAETPQFIETVGRRQGYRWIAPLSPALPVWSQEPSGVRSQNPSGLQTPDPRLRDSLLVGREAELARMQEWLAKALNGQRQVVFVTGEPGIGKTTLIDVFLARVNEARGWRLEASPPSSQVSSLKPLAPSLWIGQGQCIEHYGAGEAYLPVLEALGRLCRQPDGGQIVALLEHHAPTWLVQMPTLMSDAAFAALQHKVQGASRERMLRELAEALEVVAAEHLLVLILEDLQWSDYSTLDWLAMVARRREQGRILILGTYRPAEVIVSKHPLKTVKEELQVHGQCKEVLLRCLTAAEVSQYLARRFAAPSPASTEEACPEPIRRDWGEDQFHQLAGVIHRNTEGNPLFMVNVVDELVTQGAIREEAQQWQLQSRVEDVAVSVPENLRQLIEQQLGRLSPEEKRVLEAGSVAGAEFSAAVVAAGMEAPIEQVEEWCEEIVHRDQFLQALGSEALPDGTVAARYGFRHALYQTVLYERVSGIRRMRLHRQIGESAEHMYGSRAGERAAELAVHFEAGQDYRRAIQYLQQAGDKALQRSANVEAIKHLSRALELLKTLPDTPERAQHELRLQVALSVPLVITQGYTAPAVEKAAARAYQLCQQMEETPEIYSALFALSRFYLERPGQLDPARELGEQMLRIAQRQQDPAALSAGHALMASNLFWLGEFTFARKHLEEGLALYDRQQHSSLVLSGGEDPGVLCCLIAAWTLQVLGYSDQAQASIQKSVAAAQELSIPFSLGGALTAAAIFHQLRRANAAAQESAEAVIALATEQGFPYWLVLGTILHGWALAAQGQAETGIAQMQQGLATLQTMGVGLWRPHFLGLLAEAYGKVGRVNEGLILLAEALEMASGTGECEYQAELYRLKGMLTLQSKVQGPKSRVKASPKQSAKK